LGDDTLPTVPAVEAAASADDSASEADPDNEPAEAAMVDPGPPRALVTPTGVIVPVLAELAEGYSVRTPCGESAEVVWGTPIWSADVVLDPGHGGAVETGAVGPNGLTEKELNLDVAKRTARVLENRGISVLLTRTWDYRVPIQTRAEIANVLEAKVIVSIHHNAPNANPSTVPGTEVFIQDGVPQSARLGGLLQEEIVAALDQFDIDWTIASDAGAIVVRNADDDNAYGMIRRPEKPAAHAEPGSPSNPPEAEWSASADTL